MGVDFFLDHHHARGNSFPVAGVLAALLTIAIGFPGCRTAQCDAVAEQDLKHYARTANQCQFAELDCPVRSEAHFAEEPRRLRSASPAEPWPITLDEALQIALRNSEIIRTSGQLGSPANPILNNPDSVPSIYDPAIQRRGFLIGQRSVEAALADFDAQFATSMRWNREEQAQNNNFLAGGLTPGDTLASDTAQFSAALTKTLITGGQLSLSHTWDYGANNSNQRLFPSAYEGTSALQYRQPLLAGAGVDFTRIAGPLNGSAINITGLTQGIVISRINEDISLAEFELAVTSLVRDVETQYWQLVLSKQVLDLERTVRDKALAMLEITQARRAAGGLRSGALEETVVRELYQQSVLQVAAAQDQVYASEAELRRLLGLTINDGRILLPIDEPIKADIAFDWYLTLSSALMARPELRRQKWQIRSLELQLQAAENLLRPQLDFVADYHLNGFGDDLMGPRNDGLTTNQLGSAYSSMFDGEQTGWTLGLEYSIALRRRLAKTRLQGLELQLAKSQAMLRAQEIEISHELAATFRDLDRTWLATEGQTARMLTAEERRAALGALSQSAPDRVTLDELVRAERAVADTRREVLASYTEYTLALATLHQRAGSLLATHGICFQEHLSGPAPLCSCGPDSPASVDRSHLADDQAQGPGLLPLH